MYADILRSYSAAAIGPASNSSSLNGDWLHRTSTREPLRLKLSILSDINPSTRSILNGNSSIRNHPSMWSMSQVDQRRDDGVTLAVVGIKRASSHWIPPSDYQDHFVATQSSPSSAQSRNRLNSEPTPTYTKYPGYYSKTEKVSSNNGSMTAPFTGSTFLNGPENGNGHFAHDQQPGNSPQYRCEIDVDDALDEVFASIVRGALSDDAVSSGQRQTCQQRPSYEESKSPRHQHNLAQSFFPKRTTSSSAVFDSGLHSQPNLLNQNGQKPFRQLEKVSTNGNTGVCVKNSAPAQLNDPPDSLGAWSYQPYYYTSPTSDNNRLLSKASSQKSVHNEISSPQHRNLNLQKSEPYLNRRHESLEKIESFIDNDHPKGVHTEESNWKSGNDSGLAAGVTSYFGQDNQPNPRRHLFNLSGRGKLRAAKSESSLRMANKELLLSDKEIYQIEIMNSGLSASRVYVCQCLANLYFDDGASSSNGKDTCTGKRSESPWRRIATGVPVLVLETEQAGSGQKSTKDKRQSRKLLIRLAELGNGFKLWEDVIDAYSGYSVDRTFHTLATSADYNRRAGLSFDSNSAALKFHQHVREFSEELDSFGMDGGENGRRRQGKSIWSAFRRMNTTDGVTTSNGNGGPYNGNMRQPDFAFGSNRRSSNWQAGSGLAQDGPVKKTDISMPCCFKHVTSLKAGDVLPSAMLVNSSASQSSAPSTTNTLTRVNRSATIKSTNSKSHSSTYGDDGIGSMDSGLSLPKRAQSCTQILADHSQKRENFEDHLMSYQLPDHSNGSYLTSESARNGSLRRRYPHPHSVEPMD